MTLNLASKIPIIKNSKALKNYQEMFDQIEFEIDALLWIILSIVAAGTIALLVYLFLPDFILIGIASSIVVADLMLGYPYIKASQRIDEVEENLPDALKQMADILKAGGTVEYALREVAYAEYGPLKKELFEILRKLEEGENFSTALASLSENVNSRTVQRTVTIIIDAIRAGAGLADILDEIAEDVRETHKITRERKTRTLLQVIFMVAAGAFISPIIFGFVGTISDVLLGAASAVGNQAEQLKAKNASDTIILGVRIYIMMQVIAVSAMIALMREGKLTKTIIYFPILLFIAILAYSASSVLSGGLLGG